MFEPEFFITVLVIAVLLVLVLSGYVKSPPDKAYIISGFRKKPKILIGRAGIKVPFLERLDILYLGQMTVDIKTEQSVPTTDFINVNVDAVAKVRISPDGEGIEKASRNFLNKKPEQIAMDLQDSLQGNMREIIGTLTLKDINTNRDSFSDQVMMKAAKDMEKLGIEILSCNIQNVTDEKGLINDLGADNTSKIKKDAAIAKAQADRDVAIAQAEATRAANDARVLSETEIAQKNNELAIRQSELKVISDTKKAEADAAYEIQKQAQQKNIEIATVNAQIAKAERDSELKRQEVLVTEQALDAEVNKKADAEKYRVEQEAAAALSRRQREAEARKYEQEKEAEAKKAVADAAKYSAEQEAAGIRAKYEAEAAGIALKGKADAEARRAVGLAEAEAMEKKAEAYQKYNNAAMAEMLIRVLPDIAGEIAKPLAQIDKITIIGGEGDGNGVSQIASNVPAVMAKLFESMKETTGIDLGEVMRAGTYDAKVNRNIHVTGLEGMTDKAASAPTAPAVPIAPPAPVEPAAEETAAPAGSAAETVSVAAESGNPEKKS
ncbi:flotillin family protein [Lachnoclostridium sp. Marseille-P6806]|uniref:flotillin family protein n=1 Tax=Lachnoclostridium sp. Marseille-P6806 TaxID=2364793 RepID=UPI001F5EAA75|nr:flotillin family protein [Lachnoclostridium sp. Marseille-P6806]